MVAPFIAGSAPWVLSTSVGDASIVVPVSAVHEGDLVLTQCAGASWDATFTWGAFPVPAGWTRLQTSDTGHGVHLEVWSKVATAADVGSTVTFSRGTVSSSNFLLYGASWALWWPASGFVAAVGGSFAYGGNSGASGSTGPLTLTGDPDGDRSILAIGARDQTFHMTQITHNFGTDFVMDPGFGFDGGTGGGAWGTATAVDNTSGQITDNPLHQASIAYNVRVNSDWEFISIQTVAVPVPVTTAIPARLATIVG